MSEAATPSGAPAVEPNGITPVTPEAIPAQTPSGDAQTVSVSKEELEQLQRDAARARANQSKADRYDRIAARNNGHFKPQATVEEPSEEDRNRAAAEEDRRAEKGLIALALDPAFRDVLDADPTLRSLITTNPLAVLPSLAPEALDAEDAIALVREKLQGKAEEIKKSKVQAPAKEEPKPAAPAVPPAGGINPTGATTPDAQYEEARKNPNVETAISSMIKVGLNRSGGK